MKTNPNSSASQVSSAKAKQQARAGLNEVGYLI
jgi:hypothetical protein